MELDISNIVLIGMASVWQIPLWLVGLGVIIALAIFAFLVVFRKRFF